MSLVGGVVMAVPLSCGRRFPLDLPGSVAPKPRAEAWPWMHELARGSPEGQTGDERGAGGLWVVDQVAALGPLSDEGCALASIVTTAPRPKTCLDPECDRRAGVGPAAWRSTKNGMIPNATQLTADRTTPGAT